MIYWNQGFRELHRGNVLGLYLPVMLHVSTL